ncbi:MAG: phage holin family protein [Alphaproteobacteria bacterium]
MNLTGMIGSLGGMQDRVRSAVRRRIRAAVMGLCGGLVILGGAGFLVAAGYLRLSIEMPDYQAALIMAAILLLVGGIVIAAARSGNRQSANPTLETPPDLARQAEDATSLATHEARVQVRDSPLTAILTAVAIGAIVGLLRPNDDP